MEGRLPGLLAHADVAAPVQSGVSEDPAPLDARRTADGSGCARPQRGFRSPDLDGQVVADRAVDAAALLAGRPVFHQYAWCRSVPGVRQAGVRRENVVVRNTGPGSHDLS